MTNHVTNHVREHRRHYLHKPGCSGVAFASDVVGGGGGGGGGVYNL